MYTETMLTESTQNKNNIRQITNINNDSMPVIIYYGETPPEYSGEILTYIDTPPKYEKVLNIEEQIKAEQIKAEQIKAEQIKAKPIKAKPIKQKSIKSKPKNTEEDDTLSKRKGKCCYSKESDDSRCCGACYWLCTSNTYKERCECCPNTFCEFWKSGYIQTRDGPVRDQDRCDVFECDDCLCTAICFPFKISLFFPCFLGSVFNNSINNLCGSNRNYLF
jgi:hypothetical protein